MYKSPVFESSENFEDLMTSLSNKSSLFDYAASIRKLLINSSVACNLYMGDIDAALQICPNLETFRLEQCYHMSNLLIQSLSHHCPQLARLELPGCPISDAFIPDLSKKCKQLTHIDFSFTNATMASLRAIVDNCERIEYLDFSECKDSDAAIVNVDVGTTKPSQRPLKTLILRNSGVNDTFLTYLASRCRQVETLNLESCRFITDASLIKLISTSSQTLKTLDCSFCNKISDSSLLALIDNNAISLETLNLSACDLITPLTIQKIAQKCTKLKKLVLDGCDKILKTFVQRLSQPNDEIECNLDARQISLLANYSENDTTVKASSSHSATSFAESSNSNKAQTSSAVLSPSLDSSANSNSTSRSLSESTESDQPTGSAVQEKQSPPAFAGMNSNTMRRKPSRLFEAGNLTFHGIRRDQAVDVVSEAAAPGMQSVQPPQLTQMAEGPMGSMRKRPSRYLGAWGNQPSSSNSTQPMIMPGSTVGLGGMVGSGGFDAGSRYGGPPPSASVWDRPLAPAPQQHMDGMGQWGQGQPSWNGPQREWGSKTSAVPSAPWGSRPQSFSHRPAPMHHYGHQPQQHSYHPYHQQFQQHASYQPHQQQYQPYPPSAAPHQPPSFMMPSLGQSRRPFTVSVEEDYSQPRASFGPQDSAAIAGKPSHTRIYNTSSRGKLLLKMKIETRNGIVEYLPIHEVKYLNLF